MKIRDSRAGTFCWFSLFAWLLPGVLLADPVQADPIRVLLVGDSFSATGDDYVSGTEVGLSYADQLELDLGGSYEIVNIACPGSSLLDWTLETPGETCPPYEGYISNGLFSTFAEPELPADIVTVLLGTNDSIGWFEPQPVTGAVYASALDKFAEALLARGAETIVLMTPPDRPIHDGDRDRLLAYRETILDRCSTVEGLTCGPDFFTLLDPELDFTVNDLHPNARGHARMAAALGATIGQISGPSPEEIRCAEDLASANTQDLACRFRLAARAISRRSELDDSRCTVRLARSLARANRRLAGCAGSGEVETRATANRDSISARIEAIGAADSRQEVRTCLAPRVRSLASHFSCGYRLIRRGGSTLPGEAARERCDRRLLRKWDRVDSRHAAQCATDVTPAAVIDANWEAITGTEPGSE